MQTPKMPAAVEPPAPLQDHMRAALPGEATVSLDVERARMEQMLQHSLGERIRLEVAAASAIHMVCRNTHDIVARQDYDDALNIAAVAISRLVPIYGSAYPRQEEAALAIDMSRDRFAGGATELRGSEGRKISTLFIRRSDMLSALSLIKRTGLLFL